MVVTQYRSGAFTADLASNPDEPSHAVSSLVVVDYLEQGLPHNPLQFALSFYAHYSKIAIGHWPPLFYLQEGIWMLFACRSQVALLLFVALCGAALLGSVFFVVRRASSTVPALVSVGVLAGSKVFHWILLGVEPEGLLALMTFWATVYCGEYMSTGSRKSRNLFLAFTIAAMLVHQRGAVLFLLPFTLLPLRPHIVKWKWITAGSVLLFLLLLPPYIHLAAHLAWFTLLPRAWKFIYRSALWTGWPWTFLALFALPLLFRRTRERQFWAAAAGLALASLAFFLLVPVPFDYQYFLVFVLALALLAGGGVHVLLLWVSRYRQALSLTFSALAIGWIIWTTANGPAKRDLGYGKMVAGCLLCDDPVALIAGSPSDEGALIVEASLWDPHRLHSVLRASKVLAKSNWMNSRIHLLFASSSQVLNALDQAHVSLVLVQKESPLPEVVQLRSALEQDSMEWRPVTVASPVNGIDVYRKTPAQAVPSTGATP